jgi:hypothetical protein
MSNSIDNKEILVFNKNAIAAAFVLCGVECATAEYSGSGDDGSGTDVAFSGSEDSTYLEAVVTLKRVQGVYDASRQGDDRWSYKIVEMEMDLEEAMKVFTDDVIENFGHSGYENGDGGCGTVELFATGKLEYSHSDYITELDTTTYELDENLDRVANPVD